MSKKQKKNKYRKAYLYNDDSPDAKYGTWGYPSEE